MRDRDDPDRHLARSRTRASASARYADDKEIARRAAAIGREPEELRQNGLAGTPDEVARRIGEFAQAGAQRIYLGVLDLAERDHLALVAEQVVPRVADA